MSISSTDKSVIDIASASSRIFFDIISLFSFDTFLESFKFSTNQCGLSITAATVTGPASGPLPTSSIPSTYCMPCL